MTYIITVRTEKSILMASDTRLNYFNDKTTNDEKFQEIICVADCIRKTFFIDKAKIGIQFLGIGYFPDANEERYPLSYFIKKLADKKYTKDFKINAESIFNFLKSISRKNDTGQYVKGVMVGFSEDKKSYVCIFNTYDNSFDIKEFNIGQFVDSEDNNSPFSSDELLVVNEINERINNKSTEKSWSIGGPVEIIKITQEEGAFIQENKKIFNGTQKELVDHFNNDLLEINGKRLSVPYVEKYKF